jgi:opacity protein-like surface antigen
MTIASPKALLAAGAAACALLGAPCARAQQPPDSEEWKFEVGPWIWATGVSGYIRPSANAPIAHFNNSFSDLKLNAAILNFDARMKNWGVLADIISIEQSHDSDQLRREVPGKSMPDGTYSVFDLAGAYRLSFDPDTRFDLLAGIRYSSLDMDVNQPAYVAPASCLKCVHNEHWLDGIAGFRVARKLTDGWWLDAWADVGGGGSKTTWQALLGATWQVDEDITARFGYRLLSVDYEKVQLYYKIKTSGIYAGMGMRF